MNKLLEVENLTITFSSGKNAPEVVSGVSFQVNRGEILARVGESGCGKSASCLGFTGLLPSPPASVKAGKIIFCSGGETFDLTAAAPRKLRQIRGGHIAYIFQEPTASLNPVMRIGSQIEEVLKLHRPEVKKRKAEVISLLKQVGIVNAEARFNAYPHELSGGMQQRVMIAMALAGDPELLIADEPTTALDVTVQAQILDLLDKLRKERNMAVILISHNLGVVSRLADRIAVMYAGKIVETGSAEEVLFSPAHPYTKALISAIPVLGGKETRLNTIPGMVPAPDNFPAGCRFYGRCTQCGNLPENIRQLCAESTPGQTVLNESHSAWCHAFSGEKS